MSSSGTVQIIGAGLAGSEAAWQIARRGHRVDLFEMRPVRTTAAHRTADFAELVCSNTFKSDSLDTATGLLKEEMRRCDSLILRVADATRIPAGTALAVDRERFATEVTRALESQPLIQIHRQEVEVIPKQGIVIVATGPLVSESLSSDIARFTGRGYLYFFDAVSPIVEADSIDLSKVFRASRYGKGDEDYLNCPMDEPTYERFVDAILAGSTAPRHEFDTTGFFEGCLPIEEMARRGRDTLRFGPLKPVGLVDPRTGKRPHAVVQLRQDNAAAEHFNIVGFQNSLRWGEQERIFRMIPGLEQASFVRLGMIHRNSYINAPAILMSTFQARKRSDLFFAGQVSGVEGYLESAASGLMAGINATRLAEGQPAVSFPPTTALGCLGRYISAADVKDYQPTNMAFGLLPPLAIPVRDKRARREVLVRRALDDLGTFRGTLDPIAAPR
ncbi:MAG: methylenetetrahydrofolate--tRNA-(uracil(54)-C(5))-methyltransferase (FADH(2)-oxidizing) TrmFO [Acidobacteria bacterium]|nr:methylenetetrahydrofolate--tRNA-(uracil(54)-C(5))-methyltransferase (FADH(2)-oxidizing) TrmFO [Acidobacteriota bacterium]